MIDLEAKKESVAKLIEGKVVDDSNRVAVCVKGTVLGFPATLEATGTGFPFGVSYYLETRVVDDPNIPPRHDVFNATFCPRMARGLFGFLGRILLLERKGQSVNDPKAEAVFVIAHNDGKTAERFVKYPGVLEHLIRLEQYTHFGELIIKADAGLVLSQPKDFKSLDLDICREAFRLLGELGQVLFEAF